MFIIIAPNTKILEALAAAGATVVDDVSHNGTSQGVVFARTAVNPDATVLLSKSDVDDDPQNDVKIKMRYQQAIANRSKLVSLETALEIASSGIAPTEIGVDRDELRAHLERDGEVMEDESDDEDDDGDEDESDGTSASPSHGGVRDDDVSRRVFARQRRIDKEAGTERGDALSGGNGGAPNLHPQPGWRGALSGGGPK